MAWKGRLKAPLGALTERYHKTLRMAVGRLDVAREKFGWVDVTYQAAEGFIQDKMTLHAGNFAYSSFLGLFPLLLFVFSIVGYIFHYDQATMQKVIDAIKDLLPEMQGTVQRNGESIARLRGTIGIIGLIGLLWSMSRIAYTFQVGFEAAWGMKQRSFIAKRVYSVMLMLLLMVVAIAGLGVTFVATHFFSWVNDQTGPIFSSLMVIATHIISPCATMFIFATLYRTIPKNKPGWREILWAALPMALVMDLFEYCLGFYFTRISQTQALYGSMGIIIGVVLWLYFVGIFIFFGAEIVQVLQKRWSPEAISVRAEEKAPLAGITPESDEVPDE
jgi:membrane protein